MEKVESFDWSGWVCAYVSQVGGTMMGYVGRRSKLQTGSPVPGQLLLQQAFEWISGTRAAQGGAQVRMATGSPIEFCAISEIWVTPIGLIELDKVDPKILFPFAKARSDAAAKLKHMTEGPPLIQPATSIR